MAGATTLEPLKLRGTTEVFADDIEVAPGDRAVAEGSRRAKAFAAKWGKLYPAAVGCLMEDLGHLTTHLRSPREHWRRVRHSNFIERDGYSRDDFEIRSH